MIVLKTTNTHTTEAAMRVRLQLAVQSLRTCRQHALRGSMTGHSKEYWAKEVKRWENLVAELTAKVIVS